MPEINETYEGITIETKVNRITQSKEPITDGAPLIIVTGNKDKLEQDIAKSDKYSELYEQHRGKCIDA